MISRTYQQLNNNNLRRSLKFKSSNNLLSRTNSFLKSIRCNNNNKHPCKARLGVMQMKSKDLVNFSKMMISNMMMKMMITKRIKAIWMEFSPNTNNCSLNKAIKVSHWMALTTTKTWAKIKLSSVLRISIQMVCMINRREVELIHKISSMQSRIQLPCNRPINFSYTLLKL